MDSGTVDDNDKNSALGNLIAHRIAESSEQRITFADYMDLALYHPQYGYYATRATQIGAKGDFFTSPHLGADFGELLAEQFVQMWEILQCPKPFTLVEMGAGQGLLAADVLRYLHQHHPQFYACLEYLIIERAAPLVIQQQRQLQPLQATGVRLRWCSFEDLDSDSIVGCFFSNELVDALPVHQFMIEADQLREIYVTVSGDRADDMQFQEVVGEPSTLQLAEYLQMVGLSLPAPKYPDGYRSEINLAALDWMQTVADRLKQGFVLTIDYGYPSDRYYHPARSEGTLQCYYQHAHHSDPYIHIGRQDITAHVNFTALEQQGDRHGLRTVGFTQQGLFLMALGLGDRIAQVGQSHATDAQAIQASLHRREALHQLINPMGLGNFGVLIQSKGLETEVAKLKGLSVPAG